MDIYVRFFCVCAVLCVHVAALRRGDTPSKEFYRLCKNQENEKRPMPFKELYSHRWMDR
jgi:hypothetical protein